MTRRWDAASRAVLGFANDRLPQCLNSKRIISGYSEYGVAPSGEQRALVWQIAAEIMRSASSPTPVVVLLVVGHADRAPKKPPEQRAAFEQQISRERAEGTCALVLNELRILGEKVLVDRLQSRSIGMGVTQLLLTHAKSEDERRINRRVEVFLVQCTPPPPSFANDTLQSRLVRLQKLLETRRVDPDSTGTRTRRARYLNSKLLVPDVIDVFVANQAINGQRPIARECQIFGRNTGWLRNYDGVTRPMLAIEFYKVSRNGETYSRRTRLQAEPLGRRDSASARPARPQYRRGHRDGRCVRVADGLTLRPARESALHKDEFAGDVARKKLQRLYRDNLDDPKTSIRVGSSTAWAYVIVTVRAVSSKRVRSQLQRPL